MAKNRQKQQKDERPKNCRRCGNYENPALLSSTCRWYGSLQDGRALPCPHWEERRQKW